jgi:Flp pilus assembly pilin Flp
LPNLTCSKAYAAGPASALWRGEKGQTMAEYAVGLSVITVVVISAISLLSDRVVNTITGVANVLAGP